MKFAQADAVFAYLYGQGTQYRAYYTMGAHRISRKRSCGVYFATWAPFARSVSVVGDFNGWDPAAAPMNHLNPTGLWELFLEGLDEGMLYKFAVTGEDGVTRFKADPYAACSQLRPETASVVYDLGNYPWQDGDYMARLRSGNPAQSAVNIYQVHLTSWLACCGDGEGIDLAHVGARLARYARDMHYTHIELMPIMEHPLDASLGYQITGYYAPTARLGTPRDMMAFVDACHQEGIGVILDWVPGYFCKDDHGLCQYDGTPLYGCEDMARWGTRKFNFDYRHVWSFLASNALFWVDLYHVDGLRLDGMAAMVDLNHDRSTQRRNRDGGTESIEALEFIRKLNSILISEYPGTLLCADGSLEHSGTTRPVSEGGLGFTLRWEPEWTRRSCDYMKLDPIYRAYHHGELVALTDPPARENPVLPLPHSELTAERGSLIGRMPGSYEHRFASLRLLFAWQMLCPGKKLTFMGCEFGQFSQWSHDRPLEWFLLDHPMHSCLQRYVRDLNRLYASSSALWSLDGSRGGFLWVDAGNSGYSIFSFRRIAADGSELLCVINMTPREHAAFALGVPAPGLYEEVFNSDRARYGGTGARNGPVTAARESCLGLPYRIVFMLPGLSALVFACRSSREDEDHTPISERKNMSNKKGSD